MICYHFWRHSVWIEPYRLSLNKAPILASAVNPLFKRSRDMISQCFTTPFWISCFARICAFFTSSFAGLARVRPFTSPWIDSKYWHSTWNEMLRFDEHWNIFLECWWYVVCSRMFGRSVSITQNYIIIHTARNQYRQWIAIATSS